MLCVIVDSLFSVLLVAGVWSAAELLGLTWVFFGG